MGDNYLILEEEKIKEYENNLELEIHHIENTDDAYICKLRC